MWPGIIEDFFGNQVLVNFFGDSSYAYLFRSAILYGSEEGFIIYNNGLKDDIKCHKAVQEATMYALKLKQTYSIPTVCCICNRFH